MENNKKNIFLSENEIKNKLAAVKIGNKKCSFIIILNSEIFSEIHHENMSDDELTAVREYYKKYYLKEYILSFGDSSPSFKENTSKKYSLINWKILERCHYRFFFKFTGFGPINKDFCIQLQTRIEKQLLGTIIGENVNEYIQDMPALLLDNFYKEYLTIKVEIDAYKAAIDSFDSHFSDNEKLLIEINDKPTPFSGRIRLMT